MSNIIKLEATIDFDDITKTIEKALKLDDNAEVFNALVNVIQVKEQVKTLLEKVEKVETDTKRLINAKAKALMGDDWQTIAGQGYKITRYFAGSVYSRLEDEKIDKKFLKIVESLNTAEIDKFLEETEKLPKGLELKDSRTEVIRVTLK